MQRSSSHVSVPTSAAAVGEAGPVQRVAPGQQCGSTSSVASTSKTGRRRSPPRAAPPAGAALLARYAAAPPLLFAASLALLLTLSAAAVDVAAIRLPSAVTKRRPRARVVLGPARHGAGTAGHRAVLGPRRRRFVPARHGRAVPASPFCGGPKHHGFVPCRHENGPSPGFNSRMAASSALHRLRSPQLRLVATFSYGRGARADAVNHVQDPNRRIVELAAGGHVSDARRLFDRTPDRDVVSWTAMITAYARQGMLLDARGLFDRPDARRNVVTWTALLSGYAWARRVDEAEALFERMPERNVVSWNTMLEAYISAGRVGDACELFNSMPVRDAASWNILLAALVRSGSMGKARNLFERMPDRNVMSWTTMVVGIARYGIVDEARAMFDGMPGRNVVSWNAMISGYARNHRIDEALELFMKMPMRDVFSWNIMITGFIQNKDLKRAQELFDEMPKRNVVSWTTMMNGYLQGMQSEAALQLFNGMLIEGIRPNQVTFLGAIDACSNLAGLCEGQQMHQMICKTSFQFDTFVESALMNLYAKCGEIRLARKVFDLSRQKDLISWNGMIAAYAHHGVGVEAIRLYERMQENGYEPNDVTYVGLLSACSHSGLVDEGLKIFEYMVKDRSIVVRDEHYTCLVDLCSRAGRLDDAKRLIHCLKIKPTSSDVWSALLGGCNAYGNESIGDLAVRNLLEAEPDNAGTYTLLSNIYASAGKWKEAAKIRSDMNDRGLKKQPGCSWIEVSNKVHIFVSRDKSHSDSNLINGLLQDIHHMMRMAGTVPRDHMLNDEELVAIQL